MAAAQRERPGCKEHRVRCGDDLYRETKLGSGSIPVSRRRDSVTRARRHELGLRRRCELEWWLGDGKGVRRGCAESYNLNWRGNRAELRRERERARDAVRRRRDESELLRFRRTVGAVDEAAAGKIRAARARADS